MDNVREVVYLLGKTNKIREMLEKRAFFSGTNVEDWCLMHKENRFCCPSRLSLLEKDDSYIAPSN